MKQDYSTLSVTLDAGVAELRLNRPDRANALNPPMWQELRAAAKDLDATPEARVVVLSGAGKHFCSGIDVGMLAGFQGADGDRARASERLYHTITDLQDVLTWFERCRKPVLAAVHGACIGAGLDLAAACDLRYASADAGFSVKEVDMGLVADVGVLQRLPRIVGEGVARELAYTCRTVSGREAAELRLANRCYDTPEELRAGVLETARELAAKSPLALRGTKRAITYARDHTVADALDQVATWNAGTLLSADLAEAVAAHLEKRPPAFAD
ncbi:crotonase/enoyl-CoA hydratase family protein [Pseudonocardia acaciae]|uniref:crotonase/enoyl-CoA hydratase family protein n=1 Tax=Pseudonocardia acaciae TaxID=551276 RepID=UPI000561B76A|nr:crotonase/enoyl-CoA hydratase family protein [Pseudonocardia acaciae]